jgi:hypothetical protein
MRAFALIKRKLYLVRWLVKSATTMVEVKTRIVKANGKHDAIMKTIDLEIAANKGVTQ